MTNTINFEILISLISFLGLWLLVFTLYRDYRIDAFRQEMFSLRDDLFEFAASEKIEFNHSAYGILRSSINGFIRFGHRLTMTQTILFSLILGRKDSVAATESFNGPWKDAKSDLSLETAQQLQNYLDRLHLLALKHMIFNSPLLLITAIAPLLVLIVWVMGKIAIKRLTSTIQLLFEKIDPTAFAYGK